jgi:hypothetical protein
MIFLPLNNYLFAHEFDRSVLWRLRAPFGMDRVSDRLQMIASAAIATRKIPFGGFVESRLPPCKV